MSSICIHTTTYLQYHAIQIHLFTYDIQGIHPVLGVANPHGHPNGILLADSSGFLREICSHMSPAQCFIRLHNFERQKGCHHCVPHFPLVQHTEVLLGFYLCFVLYCIVLHCFCFCLGLVLWGFTCINLLFAVVWTLCCRVRSVCYIGVINNYCLKGLLS